MEFPNTQLGHALAIVEAEVLSYLQEYYWANEKEPEAVLFLLTIIRRRTRLWAQSSDTHVQDLWDEIRGNEECLDFVMDLTSRLRAKIETRAGNGDGSNDWTSLTTNLALAFGGWTGSAQLGGRRSTSMEQGQSLIDEGTLQRICTTDTLRGHLRANPWLVTIYLLGFFPLNTWTKKNHFTAAV